MRPALRFGSRPSSALTAAAAPLMRASQCTTGSGTVSPEMGKFSTALAVSVPHSCPRRLTRALSPKAARAPAPREAPARGAPRPLSRRSGVLPAEGHELAGHADGVVIGDQEARALQHAQLAMGQMGERLFGRFQRM